MLRLVPGTTGSVQEIPQTRPDPSRLKYMTKLMSMTLGVTLQSVMFTLEFIIIHIMDSGFV